MSNDLKFIKEIIRKLNVTYHDQSIHQDGNHFPMKYEHHTELISQWAKEPTAHSANVVCDPVSGACLEHRELLKTNEKYLWWNSFANDLGRLSQGHKKNNIKGTRTIHFTS